MAKYVQVVDGIVMFAAELSAEQYSIIFEGDADMAGEVIDVTNVNPSPEMDWLYDAETQTFSEPNLETAKTENKIKVDVEASMRRTELGTPVRDQAQIYTLKAMEAEKYITAGYPVDLSGYSWIENEVNVSGLSAQVVADTIKNNYDEWCSGLQMIETERRQGKINIDNATNYADILTARDAAIDAIKGLEL
jgi:hypothetical protein